MKSPGFFAQSPVATIVVSAALLFAADTEPVAAQRAAPGTLVPAIHFHVGAEELAPMVYPARYEGDPERLESDAAWTAERAEEMLEWWRERGPLLLRRIADYSGLDWRYGDIEVYLVRTWPFVSIQYPLVLALDTFGTRGRETSVPDEPDLHVLLLAHQVSHYLLDDPSFVPEGERPEAYEHPFLSPGAFAVEAMVNWVVYSALIDLWGRERLVEATRGEMWRSLNPSDAFVGEELMERWSLSRTRSLVDFLEAHPPGSEIFDVRDRYAREAGAGAGVGAGETPAGEDLSGTAYGIDLGATYDGEIFVAWVDRGSPADRAGVRQGDVLRTIEGRPVGDVGSAQGRLTESWEEKGEINLSVIRGEREEFFTVERGGPR